MKGTKMKLFAIMVMVLISASFATAQQHQHGSSLPVVTEIDGREHPELIPDTVAYLNFFRANSVSANATGEEKQHQNYKIHRLGLSTRDELQFRLEMGTFRGKLDQFDHDYTKQAEIGAAKPNLFWAGVKQLIAESRGRLKTNLSALGHQQYEDGVQELRSHTRYFTSNGGAL